MTPRNFTVLMLTGALALAACESKSVEPTPPAGQAGGAGSGTAAPGTGLGGAAQQAAGSLGTALKDGKEKAVAAAQKGLDAARTQFEQLKAKASQVAAEQRPAFDQAVAGLQAQLQALQTQFEELGKAGAETWQKLAADMQAGITKLTDSINEAASKFGAK